MTVVNIYSRLASGDPGSYQRWMADIDPASCRAARAALGISQRDLAKAAGIGLSVVVDFETGNRTPRKISLKALRSALEEAGVEFIELDDGSPAVRLRSGGGNAE